ncbi:MAG: non-ribosomal peptide synthetase, partial [Candidatus Scalindua sp.]|nr:non-ribosomal peptide synthetase [Candidatus Scalindua sp.]
MTDEVYVFPMSFAQERLWFLDQLEPGKPMYNIPVAIKLIGSLNVPVLEQSLNELINRHESLRTTFTSEDGQPVQVIASALSMTLPAKDLRNIPTEKQSIEIRNLISKESLHSFDLANGPLLRVTLLYLDEEEYVLLATMHHIITDGWSMGIFIRELTVLYETFLSGASSPLLELPIQYADYSDWQRKWLQGGVLDEQLEYWKQQLAGAPPVLELPLDRQRLAVRTSVGGIEC